MAKQGRLKRVGDQIQRELAQLIQQEVKDPRVGMVTVTAVDVSREFESATVYVTVMGDEAQTAETITALNRAAGFLRKELGARLKIRLTPQLHFVYDESIARGKRLTDLIDSAAAADRERKQEDGEG